LPARPQSATAATANIRGSGDDWNLTQSLPLILACRLAHVCLPRRRLGGGGSPPIPRGSLETRSLPPLTRSYPRRFTLIPSVPLYLGSSRRARPLPRGVTGHVAHPVRSIRELASLMRSLGRTSVAVTILTVPAISGQRLQLLDSIHRKRPMIIYMGAIKERMNRVLFKFATELSSGIIQPHILMA
jgi:hypothetical protein